MEGVQISWLKGFRSGGPIGLSCDLNLLSPEATAQLKEIIAGIKKNRVFWRTAVTRILCDTPSVTSLQYVVNPGKTYRLTSGEIRTDKEIASEGIELINDLWNDNWYACMKVTLEEVTG